MDFLLHRFLFAVPKTSSPLFPDHNDNTHILRYFNGFDYSTAHGIYNISLCIVGVSGKYLELVIKF